ncbi:ATP-binding protein [Roseomonas sp. F4]
MESRSVETEEKIYRFGDFRLLPARQSLLRGTLPLRVGSRALDLLRLLVERPGELITKAELIGSVWPDTFVHENNLKVHIAALRRALGEAGSDASYIATIAGRGYRFVASVRLEQPTSGDAITASMSCDAADPLPPSGIFGRDDDITRITEMLASRRFLTIVGPAGVGKTTAARAAARAAASHHPDGICFVDLAAIGDPQLVAAAMAAAIGAGGNLKDILAGIVDALRGQRKLLILDNCEHVLRAASVVADHIRAALPDIAILATSREPFRSKSEAVHRLQPLACPASDEGISHDQAMTFSAVELFVARARRATGFSMTDTTAPVVTAICRRLDGIPLALELAAPRLRAYTAPTLLRLLEKSLELLSYGPADAPLRQQTLLATLDWSYRLLSEDEAAVLRFLSVFAGAFTLEDAIGVGQNLARAPEEVVGCIDGLVSKSLLSSSFVNGAVLYRLLDTTRSYAGDRLRSLGEHRDAHTAHAAHLLMLLQRAESELQWRVHEEWTTTYGRLANDVRRALNWSFGVDGDQMLGVQLTACAIPLWDEMSSVGEGGQHVRRALQSTALLNCDLASRMKLMTAHAWGLSHTERFAPGGEAVWQESLRLAELAGDQDYQIRAALGLVVLQCFYGQHRQTLKSVARFLSIAEVNDSSAVPAGQRMRVMTEFFLGDVTGAHDALNRLVRCDDSIVRRSRLARFQFDWYVAIRTSLGVVEWVAGYPGEAVATAQAALDRATEIGHVVSHSTALVLAAIPIALWMGQVDVAERHLTALVANLRRCEVVIWEPAARLFEGMIRQERGDAEGVQCMRSALDEMMATSFLGRMPNFLSMLAEAALRHGQPGIAGDSIATALDLVERNEERWCQPEVLRVHGRLQCHEGDAGRAELTLLRAVKLARASGARMFELRAALDLADLWLQDDRSDEALALLAPICDRFDVATAGRDFLRAKRLLAQTRRELRSCEGASRAHSGGRLRRADA